MNTLNKICSFCEKGFEPNSNSQKYCSSECHLNFYLKQNKEWRLANPEQAKEKDKNARQRRRNTNPIKPLLDSAQQRAKQRGLEFNININDFEIIDTCPILGIKLDWHANKRYANSPSIDRIDNEKGYTKNNSVLCSWRANRIKTDSTTEELEKIVNFLEKPNGK